MIQAKSLTKTFGDFTAVDALDLSIAPNQCFGLLGPNGAGKSTFINMIYGMALRTKGELKVLGMDPTTHAREIKKRIGVVTQDNALDESLTVFENMMLYSAFLGVDRTQRKKRIEELLEYMNLAHKKDAKIQSLSGGMKRRLVFVRALLGKPELLILDEPTTGLDPAVRHLLWGKVKELRQNGTTVVLTTHYMHEAEVLCDNLVILSGGKVVAEGTPQKLIGQHTPGFMGIFALEDRERLFGWTKAASGVVSYEDTSGVYVRTSSMDDLTAQTKTLGVQPLQIRPAHLEDVFLKLTGKELSSDA